MVKALMESEVHRGQDVGEEQKGGFLRLKNKPHLSLSLFISKKLCPNP